MNRPSRLSQEGGGADSFEATLLRSARNDGASAKRERTLAALAIAGVAGSVAAGTVAGTKSTGAVLQALKSLGWLKSLAVIGVGLGVAGGVVGLVAFRHDARRAEQTRAAIALPDRAALPAVIAPVKEPSDLNQPPTATLVSPAATPVSTTAPARADVVAPRAHAVKATSRAVASADSLMEEASLLDRARLLLVQRDGAGARQIAEAYLARFPQGRLSGEAEVIRVRAALLTGGPAVAAPLARAFLRAHPDSPHAAALRKILQAAPAAGDQ
ncbi:MAG: hypothetical protein QOI66_4013 [Myxococcales bacterium]|jgi:hypothetical protein|nr:hypothetical protein [Myxococcales bacterium]